MARKIVAATDAAGIPRQDVVIDCLVMAASTDQTAPRAILDAIRGVKAELPGVLGLTDQPAEDSDHLQPGGKHAAVLAGIEIGDFPAQGDIAHGVQHEGLQHAPQALQRAGLLGQLPLDHLADLLQLRLRDPHEKTVLAGEIVVKSGLGDLGAFRYVVHGGLLVPFGAEELAGGPEDALAAPDLIAFSSTLLLHTHAS